MNDPLATTALADPSAPAIITQDGQVCFADLHQRVDALCGELAARGIHSGDRVGFVAETQVASVLAFWALIRLGAVACLFSPRWPPATVQRTAMEIGTRHQLDARNLNRLVEKTANTLTSPAAPVEASTVCQPAMHSARLVTIIFSSGSTGSPKAIAHGLDAHLASARGANQNMPLGRGDTWLLSLPIFHVSGLGILFRCMTAGATVAIPAMDQSVSDAIRQFSPSHLSLVPAQMSRLTREFESAPHGLKSVLLGGAPIPRDLVRRAHATGWPMSTTYGLSEMASQVCTTPVAADPESLTTAGFVLAEREVAVSDTQEILVRGRPLFTGYIRRDAIQLPCDSAGWFHTGDRGQWDDADRLIVLGRIDNQFISGGENIYPEQIELELLRLEGVQAAVVVPIDHVEFGQRPVAFVDCARPDPAAWLATLADVLPKFMIPEHFFAWPPQSGWKPDRTELRRIAAELISRSAR